MSMDGHLEDNIFRLVEQLVQAEPSPTRRRQALLDMLREPLAAPGRRVAPVAPDADPHLLRCCQDALAQTRGQLLELLGDFLLNTFSWDVDAPRLGELIQAQLQRLEEAEENLLARKISTSPDRLGPDLLWLAARLHLSSPGEVGLPGAHLLERIAFFQRHPVDIGWWVSVLLDIYRYYRSPLYQRPGDNGLLLEQRLQRGGHLHSLEELHLLTAWLLSRMPGDGDTVALATELHSRLHAAWPEHLLPSTDQLVHLQVIVTCHQLARGAQRSPTQASRLAEIKSRRQLASRHDLVLLVDDAVAGSARVPEASDLLARLEAQGFLRRRREATAPYQAALVALEDEHRFIQAELRFCVELENLTGLLPVDHDASGAEVVALVAETRQRLTEELTLLHLSCAQPLPRTEALQAAANLAISWHLATLFRERASDTGDRLQPERVAAAAEALLPRQLFKLIRPRKGYEFRSKEHFRRYLRKVASAKTEACREIFATDKVASAYHAGELFRLFLLEPLATATSPAELPLEAAVSLLEANANYEHMRAAAAKCQLDLQEAAELSPRRITGLLAKWLPADELQAHLRHWMPAAVSMLPRLDSQIYADLIDRLGSIFYPLAVARSRQAQGLPPLALESDAVATLMEFLLPPLVRIRQWAQERALAAAAEPHRELLASHGTFLWTETELRAVAKSHLQHHLGGRTLEEYGAAHDLTELASLLDRELRAYQWAPDMIDLSGVRSFVLSLLQPPTSASHLSDAIIQLSGLLPGTDCGSCGASSCQDFARGLLRRQAAAHECRQLSAAAAARLEEALSKVSQEMPPSPTELDAEERLLLQELTDPVRLLTRLEIIRRHQENLRRQGAALAICRCPDPETFHRLLVDRVGEEAGERLRPEDRRFLAEHGSRHDTVLQESLSLTSDWLRLELRGRQAPSRRYQSDPAAACGAYYGDLIFLRQLDPEDRRRLLAHRLYTYADPFQRHWNATLTTTSGPEYRIQDWNDFAVVIENSYWHQEYSPGIAEIIAAGRSRQKSDPRFGRELQDFLRRFLDSLVGQEFSRLQGEGRILQGARRRQTINNLTEMELVLAACLRRLPRSLRQGSILEADRVINDALGEFDRAGFHVAPELVIDATILPPAAEVLAPGSDGEANKLRSLLQEHPQGLRWQELQPYRQALISLLLGQTWRRLRQEHFQAQLISALLAVKGARERPGAKAVLFVDALRGYIRQRLRHRQDPVKELQQELRQRLLQRRTLADACLEAALGSRIRTRLASALGDAVARGDSGARDPVTAWIDREIAARTKMDKTRLQHALAAIARLEGDLEALTALLRGIRETADIMEAAWLEFTEKRAELPPPDGPPGAFAFRANAIEDRSRWHHCLRHGLGREESRNVAAAYAELVVILRFLVFQQPQADPDPDAIITALGELGYPTAQVDESDLKAAIAREISAKDHYKAEKIWIYTTAMAHLLAARNPALLEAERLFHQWKARLLEPFDQGTAAAAAACLHRSIQLARLKEELYRRVSELLEAERLDSFRRAIGQQLSLLDRARARIGHSWKRGELTRDGAFYLLRQYQRQAGAPAWADYLRFLRDQWELPRRSLIRSGRPDLQERCAELARRINAVLGIDPAAVEAEASAAAQQRLHRWRQRRLQKVEQFFFPWKNTGGGQNETLPGNGLPLSDAISTE